ncbi:hypothetical protein GCM10027280_18420 [Micromonospora polyrhachis]
MLVCSDSSSSVVSPPISSARRCSKKSVRACSPPVSANSAAWSEIPVDRPAPNPMPVGALPGAVAALVDLPAPPEPAAGLVAELVVFSGVGWAVAGLPPATYGGGASRSSRTNSSDWGSRL